MDDVLQVTDAAGETVNAGKCAITGSQQDGSPDFAIFGVLGRGVRIQVGLAGSWQHAKFGKRR